MEILFDKLDGIACILLKNRPQFPKPFTALRLIGPNEGMHGKDVHLIIVSRIAIPGDSVPDYSGESGDVQAFLRYMNGELSDNSLVETLDRAVCRGRTSRKERLNAMIESPKITTMIREGVKEELRKAGPRWLHRGMRKGLRQGRTQGETRFAALARELLRDSRLDDLQRALDDRKYRYALYKEYGIL